MALDSEVDPESELDITDEGQISGTVRIVNSCSDCGTELTEYSFDIDAQAELGDHACLDDEGHEIGGGLHGEYDVEGELIRTDRYETKDRKGKPIKNPRYQKHYYGAEGKFEVTCKCGGKIDVEWSDEVQASGMDSLC